MRKIILFLCLILFIVFSLIFLIKPIYSPVASFHIPVFQEEYNYKEYKERLRQLSVKDIDSMPIATNLCLSFIQSTNNLTLRDKAFSNYRNFYFSVLKNFKINLNGVECSYEQGCGYLDKCDVQKEYQDSVELVKERGFDITMEEGGLYITENPEYILKMFSKYLSPQWNEFLSYRKNELINGYNEDAALMITWDILKNRIIFWETFLSKDPNFYEKDVIQYKLSDYFYSYLVGMNNTPIFEFESDNLRSDVKESYENFLTSNKNSKYYGYIADYYELLEKDKFKYSQNTRDNTLNKLKKAGLLIEYNDKKLPNNYISDMGFLLSNWKEKTGFMISCP